MKTDLLNDDINDEQDIACDDDEQDEDSDEEYNTHINNKELTLIIIQDRLKDKIR